ncbi:unnamed protein product [Dracunculus medinensis]|uniref:NTF2 domain-containing protein n=1 Tax=Dracunculus medinensis TaxID=318479 RepID=A0A0N4UIU2_DRAME|nr:unnamed protein product [Dracunculus medinensis]
MLSERPQDVYRFYGHESFFRFDAGTAIQGQQNILKEIQRLNFKNCRARIHTVSAAATTGSGLVLQVCGELAMEEEDNRRFLQTFVLCPQTPKKYYVHNNLFEWLDRAFHDLQVNEYNRSLSETVNSNSPNEEDLALNGHASMASMQSNGSTNTNGINDQHQEHTENSQSVEVSIVQSQFIKTESSDNLEEQPPIVEPEPVTVDNEPKTWAKLVGSTPSVTQSGNMFDTRASQAIRHSPPSTVSSDFINGNVMNKSANMYIGNAIQVGNNRFHDEGCRLYIGGIIRTVMPQSVEFGPVASVNVPRRVFDSADSLGRVYAFIIMKTPQGAKNIFHASRKDRGVLYLPLKIESLGFMGDATVSEQKNGHNRQIYPPRASNMQGNCRGVYPARNGYVAGARNGRGNGRLFGGSNDSRIPFEHKQQ